MTFPHLPELPPFLEDCYCVFQDEHDHFSETVQISLQTRFRAVNELMILGNIVEREIKQLFNDSGVPLP